MRRAAAAAKINLALVVGPRRPDGRHELVTVYQRIALADHLSVELAGLTSRANAEAALARIGRQPNVRAEELAPSEFLALAEALR